MSFSIRILSSSLHPHASRSHPIERTLPLAFLRSSHTPSVFTPNFLIASYHLVCTPRLAPDYSALPSPKSDPNALSMFLNVAHGLRASCPSRIPDRRPFFVCSFTRITCFLLLPNTLRESPSFNDFTNSCWFFHLLLMVARLRVIWQIVMSRLEYSMVILSVLGFYNTPPRSPHCPISPQLT